MLNFALFMFGHCPHHVRSPFVSTQTLDLWAEAADFGGLGAGDDVKGTLSPKFDDHVHGFQNGISHESPKGIEKKKNKKKKTKTNQMGLTMS